MGNAITNISSIINQRNGVSGLVSGLDTDSLVKAALKYDQARVDKVFQNKTKLSYTSDAIRAVNNQLRTLSDSFTSALKSTQNMLAETTYKAKKVTYKGDEGAVSVVAGPKSTVGEYEISVQQLATGAKLTSAQRLSDGGKASSPGAIKSGQSIDMIADALNDKSAFKGVPSDFSFSFKKDVEVNGRTLTQEYRFDFSRSDSLDHIINTVNASGCGVKMAYSQIDDRFSITTTETNAQKIDYADENGFLAALGISGQAVAGQPAKYTLNGTQFESNTNNFMIDDMSITLKKVSQPNPEAADPTKIVSTKFTIANDFDKVVESISKFVEEYNKIMTSITTQLNEKPVKGYDPLTDEQRAAISESEAKLWDEKTKTGLLYRNQDLAKLMSGMREMLTMKMPSGYSMMDMGLKSKTTYDETSRLQANANQIELDEVTLRKMLGSNQDAVFQTFAGNSAIAEKPHLLTKDGKNDADASLAAGGMGRLFGLVKNYLSDSNYTKLQRNTTRIGDWEKDIDAMIDKMKTKSDALYKRYAAMETALSRLQSQTSALSGFGGQ